MSFCYFYINLTSVEIALLILTHSSSRFAKSPQKPVGKVVSSFCSRDLRFGDDTRSDEEAR